MAAILVADGEYMVTEVIRASLERAGHFVQTAGTAAVAFKIASEMERVDVLIVDDRLQSYSGRDVAERLLNMCPAVKTLQISAFPRTRLEREDKLLPGSSFLAKPFTVSEIQSAVSALLSSSLAFHAEH